MRSEYLKKYSHDSRGKGVSNFVLDRILDLCSLFLLIAVFSFIFKDIFSINYFYYSLLLLILMFFGLIIFMNQEVSKKVLRVIYKKVIPEKLKEKARNSFYSFYEDMPKKRYIFMFLGINMINWIVAYSVAFFAGLSVGIDIPFFYYLAILPIATLVAQIPITISGLGTREMTLIGIFGLFGIEATKVFSMSIIALFIGSIVPAILGFIFSLTKQKESKEMTTSV